MSEDAGHLDAGILDAGELDAGESDAGGPDVGEPDVGAQDAGNISSSCHVGDLVINEVQTSGASSADEFVEIWNPCGDVVDLHGARLVDQSARYGGTSDTATLVTFAGTLEAHEYLVIGGAAYAGASAYTFATGLAQSGGAVGLRDASGLRVDSVGWGDARNALVEGSPAEAPAPGAAIGRIDGYNSNDNSGDFFATPATPGARS